MTEADANELADALVGVFFGASNYYSYVAVS
jgi:hypothetical protein